MSMAHSLEARVPLTDNDLASFMERVPPHFKIKGAEKEKYNAASLARNSSEGNS